MEVGERVKDRLSLLCCGIGQKASEFNVINIHQDKFKKNRVVFAFFNTFQNTIKNNL